MQALLEMWVLLERGPYMRKYGILVKPFLENNEIELVRNEKTGNLKMRQVSFKFSYRDIVHPQRCFYSI